MSFFICGGLKEVDNLSRAQRRQDYRKMKKAAQREMLIEQKNLQLDNPFVVPNNKEGDLWRYYNNPDHFVWLLDNGLFFTKIALFEDKEEGNLPEKHNREIIEIANKINENFNPQWIGNTVIGSNPPFYSRFDAESLSRQMFASCWNLGKDQDINLWKRFGNKNVVVKTTVSRIKKGISGYNTRYGISKITYIDYEDESVDFNLGIDMDDNNCPRSNPGFNYRRFLHKGIKFRNESEVRLILFDSYYTNCLVDYIEKKEVQSIELDIDQNRFRNVWYSFEINDPGIYLPIEDPKILVEQIIISEDASKDTKEKIFNAAKRHGLENRIIENSPSQRQRVFSDSKLINQAVTKGLGPNVEIKPSGVEWIGEIPRRWKIKRLKYIADLNMGQSPPSEEYNSDQIGTPFLQGNADFGLHHPTPKIYCPTAKKHANPGDILLSVRAPVGAINIANQEYGIGRGLCAIRPRTNQLEHHYAKYLLEVVRTELHVVATGSTYDAVTVDDVSNLTCVVPPIRTQTQIANFLDRKTEQIDELIRIKERQIELLQEQRTALINQAVTKGLDPNVEMKPSGVEWIGEIPIHWEVRRNKRVFHERDDRSVTGEEELLTVSHITGVSPRSEKKNVGMFLAENMEGYKHCSVGNLVINTMWAWMGALGISKFDGIVSPSYNVYELKSSEYLPRYYNYLYRTPNHVNEIIRWSKGIWSSRWRLYPDAFFNMFTITPTFREQTQIANFLDHKTKQIDELISTEQRKIELLKEYRQSLISEAVTGKIDVRNEV